MCFVPIEKLNHVEIPIGPDVLFQGRVIHRKISQSYTAEELKNIHWHVSSTSTKNLELKKQTEPTNQKYDEFLVAALVNFNLDHLMYRCNLISVLDCSLLTAPSLNRALLSHFHLSFILLCKRTVIQINLIYFTK